MARVDVLWEDETGDPRVAPAILEDQSRGGVSLRMKARIPDGTHVTIKWGEEHVSGPVTHCRRDKGQYVVGVKRSVPQELDPD